MALSGLNCPKCTAGLRDETTECDHCHLPIGQREWKQALDNEILEATKDLSLWSYTRLRLHLIWHKRMYQLRSFGRRADTFLRRQIANAT